MNNCIIGIGSNMDAEANISQMLKLLAKDIEVVRVSEMMKTKPIGITDQADFTNGAVLVRTEKDLKSLNDYLKNLEDRMGRDRTQKKFGPRNIDLDILIWNDTIVDEDYYSRDFLRKSAAELGFSLKEKNNR